RQLFVRSTGRSSRGASTTRTCSSAEKALARSSPLSVWRRPSYANGAARAKRGRGSSELPRRLTSQALGRAGSARRAPGPCRATTTRPIPPEGVVIEPGLHTPQQLGRRTVETKDISIDQIRALVLSRSAFAPHEGRAKVFIIRRADELSVSAANALLKTLEEP